MATSSADEGAVTPAGMAETVARLLQCGRRGFTGVIQARPSLCGPDCRRALPMRCRRWQFRFHPRAGSTARESLVAIVSPS
jgi:hypothetical protein